MVSFWTQSIFKGRNEQAEFTDFSKSLEKQRFEAEYSLIEETQPC